MLRLTPAAGRYLDLLPAAINRQLSEIDIARGRKEAFARVADFLEWRERSTFRGARVRA
ncbi:MAG: hypothetical protein ACXWXY_10645 [Aeromicrobium sp.]